MQLTRFPLAVVIQLTLVDELGAVMTESDFAEYIKDGVESSRHLVPWGLGSHDRAHLVTTRWVIRGSSRDITDASSCGVCETRVMHNFFFGVSMRFILCFIWLHPQKMELGLFSGSPKPGCLQ